MALGPDPDGEGELFATLVRRADEAPAAHTVLAVHGFTDYFFNTELAEHFAAAGFRFYALDQHKCGRSWRDGQTPHFTTDLARYDRELERAAAVIATENPGTQILVYGHSAGGLIVSLWLDRVRRRNATGSLSLGGLVLNSPWLDLHGPAILRTRLTSTAIGAMSRVRKTRVVRGTSKGGYGLTLHRDYHGEFEYNLQWKPLGGFPVTFGWIHAIRRGHATLHRGLDVGVPNLILRSDHSVTEGTVPEAMQRGDAVLDVTQIARWAGCIGNRTTVVPVRDAKHDVFLSLAQPRAAAYRELAGWLDDYRAHHTAGSATGRG
ncbi:alpha/beta hydrolase [Mycobacterium sp. shizuoka-1]|uniref:alpha/beta hydrolase n=1 Tax=Mycobacterium sp. shizuoka-1 TaxID=2039281 RepID=UPI000C08A441|nr:alpha/beta hydrolase [Mycobacterium sp. shizuoka-1]